MLDTAYQRYQPRPLCFLGVREVQGYRLKVYGIRHEASESFDSGRFASAWALAEASLPQLATLVDEGRPGLGFVILHQGRTGDYFILCWWDRENELPTRVFLSDAGGWRPAQAGESFCVWDLRVLWWEREAYISTVLADRPEALDAYMNSVLVGYA